MIVPRDRQDIKIESDFSIKISEENKFALRKRGQ